VTDIETNIDQILKDFGRMRELAPAIEEAATVVKQALNSGNKILICGNGGSAAHAQHLAAELMGRYMRDRAPQCAIALTVDTSALTAIANDYGYDQVFSRQVMGLGAAGDVLIGISTSGSSASVLNALAEARKMGMTCIGFTGENGTGMADYCDTTIVAPAERTDRIQEIHMVVGHIICEIVEAAL
jgi:D-sedoheptulose 7-phosphate isomerase